MSEEAYKKASAEIAEQVKIAHDAIEKAMEISNESGVEFSFNVSYGMGGYYTPGETNEYTESHWQPSSMSC